jgi:uncharacterized protein (TIGR03435 family)
VPDSLRSERFDIVAKAAGKISGDQYWEMLQTLLEDRFKLMYHRETRDAPVYALVKKGSALGPKMSRSPQADCPENPTGANFCGVSARPGHMLGERVSMARVARELSPFAGRPVQDQTELVGAFNFQLTWTPDEYLSNVGGVKLLNGSPVDTSAPDFFSALQEQLGLKLEPKRGQVEIDRAQSPSDN